MARRLSVWRTRRSGKLELETECGQVNLLIHFKKIGAQVWQQRAERNNALSLRLAEALLRIDRPQVITKSSFHCLIERQGKRPAGRSARRDTPLERARRLRRAARWS